MRLPIVAPDSPFPDSEISPGEKQGISVTYEVTRAIDWRMQLYYMFSPPPVKSLLIAAVILGGMFSVPIALYSLGRSSIFIVLVIALAPILIEFTFMLVSQFLFVTVANFIRHPRSTSVTKFTSSLTPESFTDTSPKKTKSIKWHQVNFMREVNGDIYIVKNGLTGGGMVPREAFENLEDAKKFYEMAYKLWKTNGGAWSEIVTADL